MKNIFLHFNWSTEEAVSFALKNDGNLFFRKRGLLTEYQSFCCQVLEKTDP